jgi:probable F420-dependent oxidoreductase
MSLRFSVQIPGASGPQAWMDKVRRAEDVGFYSVSLPDHLGPSLPQFAPLLALTAAASATSRLRLAITVLNNDFRHPSMLAKEVATLDLLSNGRVDVGLGAGWMPSDYESSGVCPWYPGPVRVSRLEESVALLRRLWSGESVTFAGQHYQVTEFVNYPQPVQDPIPIMIGGSGRRMLRFAASTADVVHIVVNDQKVDRSMRAFEERLSWVADAGRDRPGLVIGLRIVLGSLAPALTPRETAAERLAAARGLPVEDLLDSPFALVGDGPAIKDRIVELNERYGVSYFTLSEEFAWSISDVVAELSGAP